MGTKIVMIAQCQPRTKNVCVFGSSEGTYNAEYNVTHPRPRVKVFSRSLFSFERKRLPDEQSGNVKDICNS